MNAFDERNQSNEPSRDPDAAEIELLSAYLEDPSDLDVEQRRRVERALAADPDVRRRFDELDALTAMLGELPDVAAPRSYRLTPKMVGARAPAKVIQPDAWYVRHTDKLRWAAAAVALLFVLTVSADLVVNGFGPSTTNGDDAAQNAVMSGSPEDESARIEAAEASDDDAAAMDAADAPAEEALEEEGSVAEEDADGTEPDAAEPEIAEEAVTDETEAEEEAGDGGAATSAAEAPDASILAVDPTAPEESASGDADAGEGEPGADATAEAEIAALESRDSQTVPRDADSRAIWRAVQFGLILVLAILLGMILILPRWRRPPG